MKRSGEWLDTGKQSNSLVTVNSNTVNKSEQRKPKDSVCWVKLYQAVPPDVPGATMTGGGTRTMATLRAMGSEFCIRPVPITISELRDAVKARSAPLLNNIAALHLEVYEPTRSATDDLTPLSPGDQIPLYATSIEPLIVVVPVEDDEALRAERVRATQFVVSIMSNLEDIPGSNGMKIMQNVMCLELGREWNFVLQRSATDFWNECMTFLSDPTYQPRLCVVGIPGIGKTPWTAFAIRMLLKEGKTVVYLIRSNDKSSWYYEFVPRPDGPVDVKVYSESLWTNQIASLRQKSTFFIVDPGQTTDSCLPGVNFKPKFMLVSSPEESHWGGRQFTKDRGNNIGQFKYFPVWDLEEILLARTSFFTNTWNELTLEEVVARFRQFGGVPGKIFSRCSKYAQQQQDRAIDVLTKDEVERIAQKSLDVDGTFDENQPKSTIIAYMKPENGSSFSTTNIEIISPLVAEKVYSKFIRDLWNRMLSARIIGVSSVLETYCRVLMARPAQDYQRRLCVGRDNHDYGKETTVALGGCKKIRMVPDMVRAAKVHPMVLFQSTDPRHALYDFMYRSIDGTFHAFQATIGTTRVATVQGLNGLRQQLGTSPLEFYYMVPEERFEAFATNPVVHFAGVEHPHVWSILVPNPNRN